MKQTQKKQTSEFSNLVVAKIAGKKDCCFVVFFNSVMSKIQLPSK